MSLGRCTNITGGRMFTFLKTILLGYRKKIINFARIHVQSKPGDHNDICAVFGYEGRLHWETTNTGGVLYPGQKIETMIRGLVGQNTLHIIGVPQTEEEIPVIYLIVFPSIIKIFGFRKFFSLIKQWRGCSTIMDGKVVVKYKLFP